MEKLSRFSQTREKQDEKGRKIRGFFFGNMQIMKDYAQVQQQYIYIYIYIYGYRSHQYIYIWLPESLMYVKLAQDSEDWPASYVATYPSRSLMCVRGYHIVFSYLVIPPKAGNAINMKGYNTL